MHFVVSFLGTMIVAVLVAWLRRAPLAEARRNPTGSIFRVTSTGVAMEAAIAGLIVMHLCGYSMSGFTVLLILGAVGNFVYAVLGFR